MPINPPSLDPRVFQSSLSLTAIEAELSRRARRKIDRYYPDTGPVRRELYKKHIGVFAAGLTHRERAVMGANRVGKALKHGTMVATPDGWVAIEDITVGQKVIAGDGSVTEVSGVYPQGTVQLYDVTFDGKDVISTCGEHLWKYKLLTLTDVWRVGSTLEILASRDLSSKLSCYAVVPCIQGHQGLTFIHDIKKAGCGQATCIEVIHPSHTFVIEHGIVTHNTESIGGYEVSCHLTGQYPSWWPGYRFHGPIKCWVSGETGRKVREVVQAKLFGPVDAPGTGMIPGDCIITTTAKAGVSDAIDTAIIKHVSGQNSHVTLKSYEMGRTGFDGDYVHLIWLDEEPAADIYGECLLRTAKTTWFEGGKILLTFTPLKGMSLVVLEYLKRAVNRQEITGGSYGEEDEGKKKNFNSLSIADTMGIKLSDDEGDE